MDLINESPHAIFLNDHIGKDYWFKGTPFMIEQPVYRYRSNIDYVLSEIEHSNVHLSPAKDFNDPFDSTYCLPESELVKEEYSPAILKLFCFPFLQYYGLSEIIDKIEDPQVSIIQFEEALKAKLPYPIVRKIIDHILLQTNSIPRYQRSDYKIVCFSETNNSIPMWAYYAGDHTGVCLQYDFHTLDTSNEEFYNLKKALTKVYYSNFRSKDTHGYFSFNVKSLQWAHEQEWRLVGHTKNNFIHLPCLSAIYLGLRFDPKRLTDIVSAIKASNRDIKLYFSQADHQKYSLNFYPMQL